MLVGSLLSEKYSSAEFVPVFPAYAVFFEELIYFNPKILIDKGGELKQLCARMVFSRMDQSFFSIVQTVFEALSFQDLKGSGWIKFVIESVLSLIANQAQENADPNLAYRPLYFKEYCYHLMRFGLKYSFVGKSRV